MGSRKSADRGQDPGVRVGPAGYLPGAGRARILSTAATDRFCKIAPGSRIIEFCFGLARQEFANSFAGQRFHFARRTGVPVFCAKLCNSARRGEATIRRCSARGGRETINDAKAPKLMRGSCTPEER
jgi:hypothetical protein